MKIKTLVFKYKWYLNRFILMSPLEIGYRAKERLRNILPLDFAKDIKPKIALNREGIRWYSDLRNGKVISRIIKDKSIHSTDKALQLMEHKFSFFSFDNKSFGDFIDWHWDYKNNKEAPLAYGKSIDYRNFAEVGDIKYIWELNRHQHLIVLAKAYYLTGDAKYKDEVIAQISGWIETNPYMKGVNWASSLEVAIRLISWSWVWHFMGEIDEKLKNLWIDSIYKHCVFISNNLSRYSSANNHLIGEAAGLFIATILWPFEKESAIWQKKSFKILAEEIEKQNYDDGVNKEQAISYQQFVLDFFILAALLGEKNGIGFSSTYWQRIEKMLEFIASIMDRQGNIPNIGDSDDGYAVVLSEEEGLNHFKSLLATAAVLFERGDFAQKAGQFDEKSFWLLGVKGQEKFERLEKRQFITTKAFKNGGYYILSAFDDTDDEIKAIFDSGPLGYLSLAAHGHSDALNFILNVSGREFIIDPGTYAYHTQKQWRDYFRGTSAHNTVRIDGVDQSVPGGNFMWIKKANTRLTKEERTGRYELVSGVHDGYNRLKDSVLHQREITFDKENKVFSICDRIKARQKHLIEQYFHFSSECEIRKLSGNSWEIKNNKRCINISVDNKFDSRLVYGKEGPILGWESKKFDVKHKTNSLVNSCEHFGNGEFITIISIK